MTLDSTTGDSLSVLKDGKPEPGIHEIQNLCTRTSMDVHDHLREVCCRPATDLEDRMGFVRPLWPATHSSGDWKWEIEPLGAGYSVQRVRLSIFCDTISATVREQHRMRFDLRKSEQFCTPIQPQLLR